MSSTRSLDAPVSSRGWDQPGGQTVTARVRNSPILLAPDAHLSESVPKRCEQCQCRWTVQSGLFPVASLRAADTNEVAVGVCLLLHCAWTIMHRGGGPVVRLHHQHHSAPNIWQILLCYISASPEKSSTANGPLHLRQAVIRRKLITTFCIKSLRGAAPLSLCHFTSLWRITAQNKIAHSFLTQSILPGFAAASIRCDSGFFTFIRRNLTSI